MEKSVYMEDTDWNTLFRSFPVIFHSIGFVMLYRTKYTKKFNKVQRFYLLNLSLSEMVICILNIVQGYVSKESITRFYLSAFHKYTFVLMYNSSYLMLTLDRFLMAYLNLRYQVVVSLQKVYVLYFIIYVLSCTVGVMLCLFRPRDYDQLYRHAIMFVWLPGDILIIIASMVTYAYIFLTRKTVRTKITTRKATSFKNSSALLIASYVICFAVPDFVLAFFYLARNNLPKSGALLLNILFSMAYSIDAFIYIFSLKSVHLSSFRGCLESMNCKRHPNSTREINMKKIITL